MEKIGSTVFCDGLHQSLALGQPGDIGELPNVGLMLDDVRSNCKEKPSSTMIESASRTFEKVRQGAFDNPRREKIGHSHFQIRTRGRRRTAPVGGRVSVCIWVEVRSACATAASARAKMLFDAVTRAAHLLANIASRRMRISPFR